MATAPSPRRRRARQHERGRLDERVLAGVHRRRAGVVGAALEDDLAARLPDDRGDDPERRVRAREHRALLDVQLEERARQPAVLDAGAAAGAASLLVAEGDDGERDVDAARRPRSPRRRRARRRSGRRSAPSRGASRARAAPSPRRPNGVPGAIGLDLEPGLAQATAQRARAPRPPRASSRSAVAPIAYSSSSRSRIAAHRPKGFDGREPVAVITDFVSR